MSLVRVSWSLEDEMKDEDWLIDCYLIFHAHSASSTMSKDYTERREERNNQGKDLATTEKEWTVG